MTRARNYLLLMGLCLVMFLPGLTTLPPLDRDEPRFAQASHQMLESGDLVNIRFQNEERLKKPVGIYWLQAASAALFSRAGAHAIWPYRLPSLAGATVAVLLTAAIGAELFGTAVGWAAAVMLAASILLGVEARLAKTDAVQLAAITAAQLALARAYLAEKRAAPCGRGTALVFWLGVGVGVLIKGPIVVMVSGSTAVGLGLLERRWRWLLALRPWPYALLALLLVLPWGIAIMLATKGAFLAESVGHDFIAKVAGAQESHGAPPGFYLVTFWATFWPFSLLAGLAVPWVWRHRNDHAVRFCLAWIVPSWLVFELVPTKLPHYTLPLFPAVACLAARAALEPWLPSPSRRGRIFTTALVVLWLASTVTICAALPLLPAVLERRLDVTAFVLAALALALALAALKLYRTGRKTPALVSMIAACVLVYGTSYDRVMPQLDRLWISSRVAAAVAKAKPCARTLVTSAGFSEPSLVFLLGAGTRFGDGKAAADALLGDSCAMALVDAPDLPAFTARLERAGKTAKRVAQVDGINLARGRAVELTLFGPAEPAGHS